MANVEAWGSRPASLPTHLRPAGRTFTITAYDAAGHVVETDTLGQIG